MTRKPQRPPADHQPVVPGTDYLGPAYWMSPQEVRDSFNEEDERWSVAFQVRDWLVLLALLLLTAAWTLLVYFLEPGLR